LSKKKKTCLVPSRAYPPSLILFENIGNREEGASEKVVAGILYRPFQGRDFIEIVFLAVSPDEQLRGYGTYIMCQLKAQAIREKLHNLLTYADNSAIDYFKKQGFNRQIGLEKEVWGGYIKDYVDSTLMHCVVSGVVDYTEVRKTVRNQRRCIEDKLRAFTTGHWIFKGLNGFKEHNVLRINLANLKPLTDIGWDPEKYDQLTSEETQAKIHAINAQFIADVHADRNAWPFHTPVDGEAVADYYSVVKDPIDLQTMKERLDRGNYYITQEMVWADLKRMMENCKFYNGKGQYYDYAQAIERKYLDKWTPKPLTDAPVTTPASAKPATPAAES
jgi:histone acetyltransferase